jgi:hypothetical protein
MILHVRASRNLILMVFNTAASESFSHTTIFIIFPSFHFVVNPFLGGTPLTSITVAPFMTIALSFRGHGILASNPLEDVSSTISTHRVLHNLTAFTLLGLFPEL